jgi:SAM-dependent methyltransferase
VDVVVAAMETKPQRLSKPLPGFPESALDRFLSAHLSNSQYNKLAWGLYPVVWRTAAKLRRGKGDLMLGQEWGADDAVVEVVNRYIRPYVTRASVAGEIGVGGGRIASKVIEDVREFYCFDVSSRMLKQARSALAGHEHVRYIRLQQPDCPVELRGRLDFVYAFDVLVHLDLHSIWRYFLAMRDLLVPGGRAFVHVASVTTPLGWEKFSSQKAFSVGGLYFMCPELIATLANHAGFEMIKESLPDGGNGYLNRDYLVVLEKASSAPDHPLP